MANTYDVGDRIRMTGTFTNAASDAIDPSTITFKIKDSSGSVTTYVYGTDSEVMKSGTGVYYVDFTLTDDGFWYYRFAGSGANGVAGGETQVNVRRSYF